MKKRFGRLLAVAMTLLLMVMPLSVMAGEDAVSVREESVTSVSEPASAAAYAGYSAGQEEPEFEEGSPAVVVVVLVISTLLVAGVAVLRGKRRGM